MADLLYACLVHAPIQSWRYNEPQTDSSGAVGYSSFGSDFQSAIKFLSRSVAKLLSVEFRRLSPSEVVLFSQPNMLSTASLKIAGQ